MHEKWKLLAEAEADTNWNTGPKAEYRTRKKKKITM